MQHNQKLAIAARKNCKHAVSERQDELAALLDQYERACHLSTLPDPARAEYWERKAGNLELRVREFSGVSEAQIQKVQLPNKKENRFSESLA